MVNPLPPRPVPTMDHFVYYHCIRSVYSDRFTCKRYNDPFEAKVDLTGYESRMIPVRRWLPESIHLHILQRELRNAIRVTIHECDR